MFWRNNMTSGMFLLVSGILLTMLGIGGVEASVDNNAMYTGVLVLVLGQAVMTCGVLMLEQEKV
jgi:hypothetical protein